MIASGGIRLRGLGDWVAVEFTVRTASALPACRDVLRKTSGEFTAYRFSNLGKGESLQLFYRECVQDVERDFGQILRLAAPSQCETSGA